MEYGLWEQAAEYDGNYRAGSPRTRSSQCYQSAALALSRGDNIAYHTIVAEGVNSLPGKAGDFGVFDALRAATLGQNGSGSPEKLVKIAKRLAAKGVNDDLFAWYRILVGNSLFRADRDAEALTALEKGVNDMNAKAVVALIHARAGRSEQAKRWLGALERDFEEYIRLGHVTLGALRQPHYWSIDVLRADLLRREAYSLLGQKAPELRALRLLRGDGLWRLEEREKAESEFVAAVAHSHDDVAALMDRARTFEALGARDRADLDLALAARRKPRDPRPLIARGRLLAERGDVSGADAAYDSAAALAPGRLDPFLAAGWWTAGPYPEDMALPQPPEVNLDPSRAVPGESRFPLRWKPADVNEDRFIYLATLAGRPSSSVYALTHIAADRGRTAMLCLSGNSRIRVWLNGRVVFDPDQVHRYHPGPEFLVPVTLRSGRNTLLVRVSHGSGGHSLRLRTDDFELDRAYLLAEFGRWSEAGNLLDRADQRGQCLHPWPIERQIELWAGLGDHERYRQAAARLADWNSPVRPDPSDTALALGLLSNSPVSPLRLIEIARQGIALNPAESWRKQPLGLACYRAGRYRDALEQSTPAVAVGRDVEAPIRAMAHWRLGEKDEARKALALADRNVDAWCQERSSGRGTDWLNWWVDGPRLIALRREANTLIDGRVPDYSGTLAKVRAYMGNLIDDRESPTWAYDLALRLDPANAAYRDALAARLIELGQSATTRPQ
jgi:tetratricopeptide (TPR) repeat protein